MNTPTKAYLEHVAIWVRDIHWHIRFFHDVLGMTMREVQGTLDNPVQYWNLGGMQFIAKPDFDGPEGRLAHLGVMCDDLETALTEIDFINGAVVRAGRRYNVPTPVNQTLVAAIKGIEYRMTQP